MFARRLRFKRPVSIEPVGAPDGGAAGEVVAGVRLLLGLAGAAGALLCWRGAVAAELAPAGRGALGVASLAGGLWASELVPLPVTAVLVTVLLYASGAVQRPEQAFGGFASPVVFFLLGAAGLGVAAQRSGLMTRISTWLLGRSGGSGGRLLTELLVSLPLQAFVVPSATSRNAILVPVYEQVLARLGRPQRLGAAIMLVLAVLGPFASSAILSGGVSPVAAAQAIGGFTWLSWFAALALPYYVLIVASGLVLRLFARPEHLAISLPAGQAAARFGRLTAGEWRVAAVSAGTSLLWMLDRFTHWPPALPALLALVLLMLPGFGVMTWQEFTAQAPWSTCFMIGGATSLATVLTQTGAAAWTAQRLFNLFPATHSETATALIVFVVATAISLAIPGRAAVILLAVPLAITYAAAGSLSAPAAGLVVMLAVDAQTLYPAQTTTSLIAYESGYFSAGQLCRFNLVTIPITLLVALFVALPWWAFTGLPVAR